MAMNTLAIRLNKFSKNIFLIKPEKNNAKIVLYTFAFRQTINSFSCVANYSQVVHVTLIYIALRGERNSTYHEQYVHMTLNEKRTS